MSSINEIIEKLDKYIMDDKIPADSLGTHVIEDVLKDDDFDSLSDKYPELAIIVDRSSDMEYESESYAEDGRIEIRKLFTTLKSKTNK